MKPTRVAQLTVAIALVALLLWKADVSEVRGIVTDADPLMVTCTIALDVPVLLLLYVRSRLVLDTLGHPIPMKVLLPTTILGNVLGSLTPAAVGELLRAGVLHTQAGVPTEDSLALVTYERLMSVYLLALTTGAFAAAATISPFWAAMVALLAALLALLPAVLSPLLRFVPERGARESRWGRILDAIFGAVSQTRRLLSDIALLGRWGVLTVTIFAINAVQFLMLTHSVSDGVTFVESWTVFGASQLAGMASLLPFGLGASDGSLAAILNEMGLTIDEGASVAALVRLTTTLPLGIAAIASYVYLIRQEPRQHVTVDDTEAPRHA